MNCIEMIGDGINGRIRGGTVSRNGMTRTFFSDGTRCFSSLTFMPRPVGELPRPDNLFV